jgi:murein DD-endopeptidase MepM/ murein hydrolase activator NlpD
MTKPIKTKSINTPPHGRFGFVRRFDVHTGFDIYCPDGEPVFAIEDGIITDISHFTGEYTTPEPMPWWENTMSIAIEGKLGVILYGEIHEPTLQIGDKVSEGQHIANVKRVLKKDKGLPMSMLHIELYKQGYRGDWSVWNIESEKPKELCNIETILLPLYDKDIIS